MAENTVKMRTPDGSVINVAEKFVDVFLDCGYTLVKKKAAKSTDKKAEK